jgi:hypothetical protein
MVHVGGTNRVVAEHSGNMPTAYRWQSFRTKSMQYSIAFAMVTLMLPAMCMPEPAAALVDGPAGYATSCSIRSGPHLRACDDLPSARSCAAESHHPSLASKESTGVTFVNRSDEPIKIYWLSFQGERKLYHFLPPGSRQMQKTFIGHNWLVTNLADQCIGIFAAAPLSIAFF